MQELVQRNRGPNSIHSVLIEVPLMRLQALIIIKTNSNHL